MTVLVTWYMEETRRPVTTMRRRQGTSFMPTLESREREAPHLYSHRLMESRVAGVSHGTWGRGSFW